MLDESSRKSLLVIVEMLEACWLRNLAAEYILEYYKIPDWERLIDEYCDKPESKARARERFAAAYSLLHLAQIDSAALESLLKSLRISGKPS